MMSVAAPPLIIRFGALGDLVMATAVMRALAARHGRPCDVVAHGRWAVGLLAGLPFVGQVHCVPSRNSPYWFTPAQWRLVAFLRERNRHPAWLLESDAKSAWFCRKAGLELRGGIPQAGFRADEHQVDMHRRVCGFADDAGYRRTPELAIDQADLAACRAWLKTSGAGDGPILVHAGNKRTQRGSSVNHKEWPQERWVELIRRLRSQEPERTVLLTGTPSEAEMTEAIAAACGDARVHSCIAGSTPVRRMLSLLACAHSCVSVDTGPAHAAAAVGCPLVVLFGSTDPRVNGPVAERAACRIVTGPEGAPTPSGERAWGEHHQMSAIGVDQVHAAWERLGRDPPGTHGLPV
ncbi:MAG TPA: hypothetical protein DCS97_06555 [Planctomycetes bacterium]|nr:hypothetical protein [Planctomycetota bacterium]